MLGPSGHIDTFCRDGLPDAADWPDILHLNAYPDWLNAGVELSDATAAAGHADRIALRGRTMALTYAQLAERTDRIAQVLIEDMGVVPGNRVLLFGGNTPALVSALLGILKAGAVAVNIMPLLRAGEIDKVVYKARATHALCDLKQAAELDRCDTAGALLRSALSFDGTGGGAGELDRRMAGKTGAFTPVPVGRDDVAIIGFTSAIAAYGAFAIPKSYGTSIVLTGGPSAALWGFMIFYVTCALLTWWVYTRRGGLLHDIERGRTTADAAGSLAAGKGGAA